MKIQNLFAHDIFRPINGVVKADQLDDDSVWQKLEEFVVTRELDKHLRTFFSTYGDALSHPNDPEIAGKTGVWGSGFFDSGKSHFIKVLSYLLRNQTHGHNGDNKRAVEFFAGKIKARIEHLSNDAQQAASTPHRKKLEKEQDALRKQQTELIVFDEKLRHYADMRISLDLDDGVKVNYGKFGDLLAEVKAVCGEA